MTESPFDSEIHRQHLLSKRDTDGRESEIYSANVTTLVTALSKSPNPQKPHIPLGPSASPAGAIGGAVVTLSSKHKNNHVTHASKYNPNVVTYAEKKAACLVDCDTLISTMALRKKYQGEANSHRNMLLRRVTETAIVDHRFYDFREFLRYMGPKPFPEATVDRIIPDGPYAPGNVRWLDKRGQANNRRNTLVFKSSDGRQFHSHELAKLQKVSIATIRQRHKRGWTHDEIIAGESMRSSPPPLLPAPVPPVVEPPAPEVPRLETTWRQATHAKYPKEAAVLTPRDKGMLQQFFWLCSQSYLADRAAEVIEHTIHHWHDYTHRTQREQGVSDTRDRPIPTKPSIRFLITYPGPALNLWMEANNLDMRDLIDPNPHLTALAPDPERDNL